MRFWIFLLFLLGGCVTQPVPQTPNQTENAGSGPVITCKGIAFHAVMHEKQATLYLPGLALSLPRMPSDSGVRYAANSYVLWRQGDNISFRTPEKHFRACELRHSYSAWANAWLRGVDFRALGNEPGWILEISDARGIHLRWNYGKKELSTALPPVSRKDGLFSYQTSDNGKALLIEVMDRPCRDSMKGDTHDYAVRVRVDDKTLLGCGRGHMPVMVSE